MPSLGQKLLLGWPALHAIFSSSLVCAAAPASQWAEKLPCTSFCPHCQANLFKEITNIDCHKEARGEALGRSLKCAPCWLSPRAIRGCRDPLVGAGTLVPR